MRDVDLPATTAAIVSDPVETQTSIEASMLNGLGLSNLVAFSAQLAVEAVVARPVPPAQPVAPISAASREFPLQITSTALNKANFISPMKLEIFQANTLARMASPDTLSRQRRTLRNSSQRIITLGRSVVENESGCINFFAAACRHPGLTGFEFDRADASLLGAAAAAKDAQPRFMLMLGDQIYADARAGLMDTESPIEKFVTRYRNAFGSSAGFRKLAQAIPLYMVIDDHEINNNWSREQTLAGNKASLLAKTACETFSAYQYVHGPGAPADLTAPPEPVKGFNYSYTHNGLSFIVLDTRTQRKRVPDRKMLHPSQWRWLENWLMEQQKLGCQPKFIVSGSVVAPGLKEHVRSGSCHREMQTHGRCPLLTASGCLLLSLPTTLTTSCFCRVTTTALRLRRLLSQTAQLTPGPSWHRHCMHPCDLPIQKRAKFWRLKAFHLEPKQQQ